MGPVFISECTYNSLHKYILQQHSMASQGRSIALLQMQASSEATILTNHNYGCLLLKNWHYNDGTAKAMTNTVVVVAVLSL